MSTGNVNISGYVCAKCGAWVSTYDIHYCFKDIPTPIQPYHDMIGAGKELVKSIETADYKKMREFNSPTEHMKTAIQGWKHFENSYHSKCLMDNVEEYYQHLQRR